MIENVLIVDDCEVTRKLLSDLLLTKQIAKKVVHADNGIVALMKAKNQKFDQSVSSPAQLQKLSVLPLRCIGCGKCARIDSTHFEMNPNTGKAMVISSTNLDSQNLSMAINICPASAITLE
jgi:ferredoxin